MRLLPITANLNPFAGAQSWIYLLESAALTRLVTGMARVYQNRPSVQDPSLSETEKRQACLERFFVEIIGTIGYIACLHLGQDITSKFLEPGIKRHYQLLIDHLDKQTATLTPAQIQNAKQAITEVYGGTSKNIISRFLYGYTAPNGKKTGVSLARLRTVMADNNMFEYLRGSSPLDGFASALRRRAAFSILGGVGISALYGGFVTQWLNDRVFAPTAHKMLEKRFQAKADAMTGPQENAQFAGPQPSPSLEPWTAVSAAPDMPTYSAFPQGMAPPASALPNNSPTNIPIVNPYTTISHPSIANRISPFASLPTPGGLA